VPVRIRRFLYLDLERAIDWLAQLERGLYRELEVEVSERVARDKGFKGELGGGVPLIHLSVGGSRGTTSEDTQRVHAVLEQVAPSYAARLFDQLEDQDGLERLEELDAERWRKLRRGAIIESEVDLSFDLGYHWMSGFDAWQEADRRKSAGTDATAYQAESDASDALQHLPDSNDDCVKAIARLPYAPEFKLIFALKNTNLVVPKDELKGEVEILAQIDRKYGDGVSHEEIHDPLTPVARVTPVAVY
jgi:hypothetical protein